MKALVDEKALYARISGNGQMLAPLALVILSLLTTDADGWLVASATTALLIVYAAKRWDGMWLFIYGNAMLILCGILMFSAERYVDWAAVQAYWLLAAGSAGMALGLIKAPASPRGNQRNLKDIRGP